MIHSEIDGALPWVESLGGIRSANSTHLHPPAFVAVHFADSRCGCRHLSASENLRVWACPSIYVVKPVLLVHYKWFSFHYSFTVRLVSTNYINVMYITCYELHSGNYIPTVTTIIFRICR